MTFKKYPSSPHVPHNKCRCRRNQCLAAAELTKHFFFYQFESIDCFRCQTSRSMDRWYIDRIVYFLWQAEVGHCVDLTPLQQGSRCCVVVFLFFLHLPQLLFLLLQSLRVKTTATKIPLVALRYKQVNLSQVSIGVSTLSHLYLKYEFGL